VGAKTTGLCEARLTAPSYGRDPGDLAGALSLLLGLSVLAHASDLKADLPVVVTAA
jgi:hypothetical protein